MEVMWRFGGTELFFNAQANKWALQEFSNSKNGVIFLHRFLNRGVQFGNRKPHVLSSKIKAKRRSWGFLIAIVGRNYSLIPLQKGLLI